MIILILIRINQYHMGEKGNQDQVIRVEKESLTIVRSDATVVKAGKTLQMNVEVQMKERRRRNTVKMRLIWHKQSNRMIVKVIQMEKQLY